MNTNPNDPQLSDEGRQMADDIFGDGKFAPGYKRVHWEEAKHGFAVRGDLSNPHYKAAKEGSFKDTAEWFMAHL
jgi:anti-sigma factor RsiW